MLTLDDILSADESDQIAPMTSRFECARRADGAASIIVASTHYLKKKYGNNFETKMKNDGLHNIQILGNGEASGPL